MHADLIFTKCQIAQRQQSMIHGSMGYMTFSRQYFSLGFGTKYEQIENFYFYFILRVTCIVKSDSRQAGKIDFDILEACF